MSEIEPIPAKETEVTKETAIEPSAPEPEAPQNPWQAVIDAKQNRTPQYKPKDTKPEENTRNPKLRRSKQF